MLVKNYKFALCAIMFLFFSQSLVADTYKILFLNTSNININGKELKVGNTFDSSESINWDNESQAVKVMNLSTNKIMVLASKDFTSRNCSSLDAYFIYTERLSTRDAENGYNNMSVYLLDEISIPDFGNDRYTNNVFIRFATYRGIQKIKLNIDSNGNLIIPREIFGQINKPLKVQVFIIENLQELCLIDNMTIIPLPLSCIRH